jgi:hypothetical protein
MKVRRLLAALLALLALTGAGTWAQTALAAPAETCDDGTDNDGDGDIDLEDSDCSEPTVRRCADGKDNDGDGLKDLEDPGCRDADDDAEADLCQDGEDNDGDGKVDEADSQCEPGSGLGGEQAFECNDGKNNADGDELVDYPDDPGCTSKWDKSEKYACDDDIDNDRDGKRDENDPGCDGVTDNDETNPPEESCADQVDNDRDGLVDLDDPDCEEPVVPACSNGVDDDEDGKTDFGTGETNDPGCESAEDDDESDDADPCSIAAGDAGLTGGGTFAQQAWDGGASAVPVFVNPNAGGTVSSQVRNNGNGTDGEQVTDEVSCLLSLPAAGL